MPLKASPVSEILKGKLAIWERYLPQPATRSSLSAAGAAGGKRRTGDSLQRLREVKPSCALSLGRRRCQPLFRNCKSLQSELCFLLVPKLRLYSKHRARGGLIGRPVTLEAVALWLRNKQLQLLSSKLPKFGGFDRTTITGSLAIRYQIQGFQTEDDLVALNSEDDLENFKVTRPHTQPL